MPDNAAMESFFSLLQKAVVAGGIVRQPLQRAGLVTSTKIGQWTHYKRDDDRLQSVGAYLRTDL